MKKKSSDTQSRIDGRREPRHVSQIDEITLSDISYYAVLRWCADADGRLQPERLKQAAAARGYPAAWVWNKANKRFDRVWQDVERWQQQQRGRERGHDRQP